MKKLELLNRDEAARYIGVAPTTLCEWSSTGRYSLPFKKIGGLVRYTKVDLDKWVESRTVTKSS